uniref:Uncharacterized protein n=1 Tax=Chromera velia CCMP2878 TaxID=1169474 RepID=A0A0G4GZN5_9ALVE|eukprot:Cvel_5466.t1-p1 / transcript=Cvel_5466.t1 / gene=Cvel_5466 / organism=Chromera_velia_CCMP2878 / gene_product=hypothetical protein / transcript_product=hypothetical protein / location=Cvel_scaffold255:97634-98561(-) / protein_length=210 / sequence_SO=supercontig / SO=protein_coding / is_pseudo=false
MMNGCDGLAIGLMENLVLVDEADARGLLVVCVQSLLLLALLMWKREPFNLFSVTFLTMKHSTVSADDEEDDVMQIRHDRELLPHDLQFPKRATATRQNVGVHAPNPATPWAKAAQPLVQAAAPQVPAAGAKAAVAPPVPTALSVIADAPTVQQIAKQPAYVVPPATRPVTGPADTVQRLNSERRMHSTAFSFIADLGRASGRGNTVYSQN